MSEDGLPPTTCTLKDGEIQASELLKLSVEVWKKTVDVQQHFNDIALRLRSIAITVLVGALGAAFYVGKDAGYWVSLAIVVLGAFGWTAFYVMDRFWYHLFLRAAGIHAGKIEKRFETLLPEMGLATTISATSGSVELPAWPSKDTPFFAGGTYSSTARLILFYRLGYITLTIAAILATVLAVGPHVPAIIKFVRTPNSAISRPLPSKPVPWTPTLAPTLNQPSASRP